jgi:hypothetical protein
MTRNTMGKAYLKFTLKLYVILYEESEFYNTGNNCIIAHRGASVSLVIAIKFNTTNDIHQYKLFFLNTFYSLSL